MASSTATRNPPAETDNGRTATTHSKRSTGADRNADIVLGAAVIAMGLLAGLNYDWAITVMPALTAADDRTLVDAMQQTIDNPAFPLTFLGAGALAAVALFQARRSDSPKTAGWIVAGLARRPSAPSPGRSSCADACREPSSHTAQAIAILRNALSIA